MSTQHPDNASNPHWVRGEVFSGEEEVFEAFYAFSELGCNEQMWDWEGKDVDPHVVRKLLTHFPEFFKENILGRDVFITYRVPNPEVERAERKGVIEALETIPRAYDIAKEFYGKVEAPPIFEVILPLTKSARDLIRLFNSYAKAIIGRGDVELEEGYTVKDWVGAFSPKRINVIPLVEDMESIFNIKEIVSGYVRFAGAKAVRVFIARSDPALNYGLFSAVILSKLALMKLRELSEELGVAVYPIIGTGSPPFRGHLTPDNLNNFLKEYRGYRTVTIQSALKYDVPLDRCREAISTLNKELRRERGSWELDEVLVKGVISKLAERYRKLVEGLAPLVNYVAKFVPKRRLRKLHIGLYGYSREIGRVKLPRAIEFVASLSSLGMPPEFIGLSALSRLSEEEFSELEEAYLTWRADLRKASSYVSWDNLDLLLSSGEASRFAERLGVKEALRSLVEDLKYCEESLGVKLGPRRLSERRHLNATNNLLISLLEGGDVKDYLLEAAKIRGYLG